MNRRIAKKLFGGSFFLKCMMKEGYNPSRSYKWKRRRLRSITHREQKRIKQLKREFYALPPNKRFPF